MITFSNADVSYTLPDPVIIKEWIGQCTFKYSRFIAELNFVFCSDEYLYKINRDHLNHFTYTDIITFNWSESEQWMRGEIFISIDRVTDNAMKAGVDFYTEVCRVIIHGVLHLIGYADATDEEKDMMRRLENECLSLLPIN